MASSTIKSAAAVFLLSAAFFAGPTMAADEGIRSETRRVRKKCDSQQNDRNQRRKLED